MTQLEALVEEMTRQGWPKPSTWSGSFRPGSAVWWGDILRLHLAALADLDDKFTVWRTTVGSPDVPARIHADSVEGAAVALEFLRARLKPGEIPCLDLAPQGWRQIDGQQKSVGALQPPETDAKREARLRRDARRGDFAPTDDIPFLLRLLDEQHEELFRVLLAAPKDTPDARATAIDVAAWLAERARSAPARPDWTAAAHRHDPQFRPQF